MENGLDLMMLVLSLFLASYLPGIAPLYLNMDGTSLHMFSICGCGLLLGTCLAVVLPEGIETLQNPDGVGLPITFGFVFMLALDYFGTHNHDHGLPSTSHKRGSVTLGLLIHAATDGIALGATRTLAQSATLPSDIVALSKRELVILVAVFCHKIPAALALSVYLKSSGLEDSKVRRSLFVFAIAAPIMVIITYFSLSFTEITGQAETAGNGDTGGTKEFAGMCLLFSAGTFLYVSAVHVLGDVDKSTLENRELAILVGSCFVPVILMKLH